MNILLTSVGRRTYMIRYFQEILKGFGLVHASNSIMTYSLLQADKYVLTPNIYDNKYTTFLLEYCITNKITVIVPLFDIDLPILAKHKQLFKEYGIVIVVSDYDITQICNDKWRTYNFLKSIGLPQPLSFLSIDKIKQALISNTIHYPVILKPRWGMGSIGIYKAYNDMELEVFSSKLKQEIFETYLKYESKVDEDLCVIFQQMINGQEYGIEVLNDFNGNYVSTFAKKKIAMRAGETDIAEIVSSKQFEHIGKIISSQLKHVSNLDIDCFITEDDTVVVLEMNCRFGGQYPFTHLAGVNIPRQIIEWLQGLPTNTTNLKINEGVVVCKEIIPVVIHNTNS